MSKIILDVRSGERNDSSTGLCLRVVDGSVVQVGGRYERVGRDLYEIGNTGVDSYALISSGDGEIGVESVDVSFEKLFETAIDGVYYYLTNSRVWLSSVLDENGVALDHFFGGTVVHSARDDLDTDDLEGTGVCGGLFWWTRNDSSRTRFDYENRGWSLLKGGAGSVVGVVGGEDDIIAGLEGELRIGGGNVADGSVTVFEIGSEGVFPVVAEGEEESEFTGGAEGVVLNPSGKVLFKDGSDHVGKEVLYISGSLGGFESNVVGVSDYLSPQPRLNEYPLLRVAGYGYSDVVYVATEGDLVDAEYGKVKVALDSGKILSSGQPVIYDGLVLCDAPIGVGAGLAVDTMKMDIPDGSGLEPSGVASSFKPTGVGLKWDYRYERMYVRLVEAGRTLPVELVEKLPKRLSILRGYLVQGTTSVVLSRAWSTQTKKIFSGHVALSRGGLRHMSILGLSGKSGSFKVDGGVVSFTGENVVGSGVSVVDGYLVVDSGSIVDHPSTTEEFESLRSIGLVPSSSLETGLEFVLTRSSVKGYYSFDEEKVADISGSTAFQFLQFEPRFDFTGYEAGKFFKIGDKVLGETDIETSFGGNPNGFHWIVGRTVSSKVNQETSRLALGSGLRVGSTSITITQEQLNGSVNTQILTEGVDYDLPSAGLEGQARLINRLGSEVLSGQKVGALTGVDLDLSKDLSLVRQGDFFYDGLNYFKIVAITGTVITLSSVLGIQLGRWKIYRGYREGLEETETPDPTKVVGEILDDLPVLERRAVEVYKVYSTLAFDKVLPSSTLFVRKDDVPYPLTVLRDDVLLSPYELSGDHYTSGSYRIKVSGIEYEVGVGQSDKGFTVTDNRVVFESPMGVANSSWVDGEVIFVRRPRSGLVDTAEMDFSLTLTTPFDPDPFDDFLELLANPRFEATSGAISFEDPLEVGVGVEVSYTPTDDPDGVRIIEAMGFVVIQEEATRVNGFEFTYNTTGKEVELLASPTVFVGPEQIHAGLYSIGQDTIRFSFEVSSTTSVKVSYTTLKSNGGDGTVRTSSGMVIPKYKIDKGATSLSVQRDFTSVLGAGDLIYVGTQIFNVVSVSASNISVNPPARVNIESEMIAYLNVPSFTYGATTSSYAFRSVNGANITAKPKSPDILIQGDYRDFIKTQSIVVLQGTPYRVKVVGLDDVTGMTKVTVEGFTSGHDFISNNDFHISFRPVLIEGDTSLTLNTGLVDTESFQFIKYNHTDCRGRLLTPNEDYKLNSEAGLVNLTNGHTVSPQVSYYLLHTALSGVKPFTLLGGRVSKPTYKVTFNQSTTPESYDGLGLNVSCVVSSPDTFQIRIADDDAYSSEIANELQQSLNQGTGSGGKLVITSPTSQGKAIGFYDLLANDVVARSRISLYNGYVQPVDDLISTTTGKVVGDVDGSFKFNLLSSGDWIAPGLEDHITREIYPRYVSMEYLTPLNPDNHYPIPSNPILIGGLPPEAKVLASILEQQRSLIENEMDDYVLIRQKERTVFDPPPNGSFPYVRVDYDPVYSPMWKRHRFSRLFPTSTRMYSSRNPGALDSSTNGITIANVKNNAIGQIENITSLPMIKRRPARFRVYDFSLTGFPSIDAGSSGKPTFILSALPLDEFPIDPLTDLPNVTQFLSEGGGLADVIVGNVDKTFNGLQAFSKLKLSRNGGDFYPILNAAKTATLVDLGLFPPLEKEAPRNATVSSVLKGCLVVLNGNAFTLKINDESLIENPPKRGDTLIESFARDLDEDSSPTTTFRVGSDIGLKSSTGELVDISLPSINDPDWPIKEIVGQNVPSSGLALEGNVDFLYSETTPFNYPALQGQPVDDTGDESIPYMSRFSERDLLPQIPPALNGLQVQTLNEYVYPDEARGTVDVSSTSITTTPNFSNLNGICEQTPRQGDLMILKPDSSDVPGCASTGVLEIATINGTEILPPAYTTSGAVSCRISNLMADFREFPNGVFIEEDWPFNAVTGLYDRSELKMYFYQHTIEDLFDNPQAGLEIIVHIHNFDDNVTNPNINAHSFRFRYDGANWEVALINELTPTQTIVPNLSVSATAPSELTIVQYPVPNPFDPATETWADPTDMGSWLFDDYWDSVNHFYNPISPSGGFTGYIFTQRQGGSMIPSNYRISVKSNAQISNNRVDVVFPMGLVPYAFIQDPIYAGGSNTDQKLIIDGTTLDVKEEDGVGTDTITSDVNDGIVDFLSVNSTTLRPKYLDSITRTDDQMSIFIGSEVDETSTILQGTARSGLIDQTGSTDKGKGVLRNVSPLSPAHGSVAQVLTGDLLYIESGHNAGTHRVLDVIETDISSEITETLGSSQVLPVVFPKVVSLDTGTGVLTTDVADLTQYFSDLNAGSIYIILNDNYTNTPTPTLDSTPALVKDPVFGVSIIKVDYNLISGSDMTLDFPCEYADGTTIADATGLNTILGSYNQVLGGVDKIPFNLEATGLASNGLSASFGVDLTLQMAVGGGITGSASASNTPANPFLETQVVRTDKGLVSHITLDVSDDNLYPVITDTGSQTYGKSFLSPNDTITLTVKLDAGIYLDTAFPRLLRDYKGNTPVEFGDDTSQVRSAKDSTLTNLPAWDFYEEVNFTVRRLRRFTDVFSKLIYAFEGFRYLYEQRVGRVDSVAYATGVITLTPLKVDGEGVADVNGTDTQVGDFTKVVSVGDQVRCVNASNQETLYLRVLEVGSALKCSAIRGSVSAVSNDDVFKIITRVPQIPELQAFDQFIEHGFTEIHSTNPVAGISVGIENILTDTNADFISLGVATGDFLVIDPQGELAGSNPTEYGASPKGDNGDGTVGSPHVLDDNRGAYKVVSVDDANTISVQFYAGDSGTARTSYKLLPSVNGDDAQPLRETSSIVGSSYATNNNSIHPFSYRILRRKTTLGESLAGSFLFFRERTLSWVEVIRSFNTLPTQPYTWSQYEAEGLIDNVGIADNSHPSNEVLLQNILGNEAPNPFENNETCLSVYDRRMLIEDPKMASEGYGTPEEGIPTVLENDISSMNARDNRYAWISVRTDQVNGTLSKLSRVDLNNPDDTALEDIK